ncbi:SRPBCC family protein [Maritalea sp.]|uniref:SRPBCC family protein n=1 Tax=Maritalea sp. TaxID=2003361 RepID=UPI003EF4172A
MSVQINCEQNCLTAKKIYDAAKADVFDAWIDAAKTTHWWGCEDTSKVQSDIEPQQDGCYRHKMTINGVGEHTVEGKIITFDPPNLLIYQMPGFSADQIVTVRVIFEQSESGTLVTLMQSPVHPEYQEIVSNGWRAAFERLGQFFDGQRRVA